MRQGLIAITMIAWVFGWIAAGTQASKEHTELRSDAIDLLFRAHQLERAGNRRGAKEARNQADQRSAEADEKWLWGKVALGLAVGGALVGALGLRATRKPK